ncbi:MAG: formylglycine-generating enzyme family protein [Candidatus Competibacteraceae bacterium]
MNNEPREKLRELIVEYGRSLCDDPRRCEALLKDYCGQYKREIFVLITAQKNRVADDLIKAPIGVPQVMILARLVKRLEDELAMTAEAAQWAVESWVLALAAVTFDEDSYRQAVPFFKQAVQHFAQAVTDAKQAVKLLIDAMLGAGLDPSIIAKMKPHALRFIQEVQSGKIDLTEAPAALPAPPVLKPLSIFHDRLRDGSAGPAMITIPAGGFCMGSPESEAERKNRERRHWVKIEQPFAIGQYAVTFDEYDLFCVAEHKAKLQDEGWGRGNRPVINVSWVDALDYTEWLSAQTGQNYRLPTEAEWEYAARAGTETAFWWGNGISPNQANYKWDSWKTVPVDQFQPNPWGLYQVHGNVWELTGSRYDENYGGAEMLSVNKITGGYLAVRGGSWGYEPSAGRSAFRFWASPTNLDYDLSFRLARSFR